MFNDRAYGQSQAPSSTRMRHAGRSHPNRSFPRHASNDNAPYSDAHSIPSPCFPMNCRCAKTWKPSQTSDRRDSRHEAPDTRSDTTLHERNHRPTAPVPAATHRHATGGTATPKREPPARKTGFHATRAKRGDTGTHRTQIHRFVIFESGHNRRAGHFGSGGATLTDERQQKTAVCANNHMFSAQIAHRLTRNERSRSGTRFRCAANRETIEIPTPTKHIHQRGDAIIRKRSHQAFESEPFDG